MIFFAALELMNDVYLFDMLLGGLIGGVMGSFFYYSITFELAPQG